MLICECQKSWPRQRRLLYCRALLGEPYYAKDPMKGYNRPPDHEKNGQRYSCIVADPGIHSGRGDTQVHREFVLWNHQGPQVYPEYILDIEIYWE